MGLMLQGGHLCSYWIFNFALTDASIAGVKDQHLHTYCRPRGHASRAGTQVCGHRRIAEPQSAFCRFRSWGQVLSSLAHRSHARARCRPIYDTITNRRAGAAAVFETLHRASASLPACLALLHPQQQRGWSDIDSRRMHARAQPFVKQNYGS